MNTDNYFISQRAPSTQRGYTMKENEIGVLVVHAFLCVLGALGEINLYLPVTHKFSESP
jgi:hypothetical protein